MSLKFKIRFFAILSIILLCVGVTFRGLQNDTFYIIKLGDYIFHNGVDLVDHYCWITDLFYTYPHWLYDLLIYIVYINFDFNGIYVSTIVLFIFLILSIYVINLKINKDEFMALFISIISILCLYAFATARAQLITIILFLWQVYFIEKLLNDGNKIYIFYLIIISWLVANMHATIWLFCFILYLPFLVEHLIHAVANAKFTKNRFSIIFANDKIIVNKYKYIKKLIISFVLSFCVGIFTPSRICYSYIFRVMLGNSQLHITEHAPMIIIEHPCFIVFIFIILLILIFGKTKIKLNELFMLCGLMLMSLVSFRHIIFFYVIGGLYLSIFVCRYLSDKGDKTFDILCNLIVKNNIVYFSLIIFVIVCFYSKFLENSKQDYVSKEDYPVDAVNFIKDNLDYETLRLYNGYNYGSYLLFNDIPVFIDSRCDLYLKEFNGMDYSIFDDAVNIMGNYEKRFEFYDVSHVLISKHEGLYFILRKDDNYNLIYEDDNFILFEKI